MDNKTQTRQTGQARGKLQRLERDLGQVKRNFKGATRNRIVGGALILIGVLALIGFLMNGGQFVAFIAVVCLFVGGLMFIRAWGKMKVARLSIDTMTDGVARRAIHA